MLNCSQGHALLLNAVAALALAKFSDEISAAALRKKSPINWPQAELAEC
jgi:hypothetical protein